MSGEAGDIFVNGENTSDNYFKNDDKIVLPPFQKAETVEIKSTAKQCQYPNCEFFASKEEFCSQHYNINILRTQKNCSERQAIRVLKDCKNLTDALDYLNQNPEMCGNDDFHTR